MITTKFVFVNRSTTLAVDGEERRAINYSIMIVDDGLQRRTIKRIDRRAQG